MAKKPETKHERFLRLMQRRLGRALEELRLVAQLSSENYENTPNEAKEVITHLDDAVRLIAGRFDIEYATRIGKGSSHTCGNAEPLGPAIQKVSVLDEIEIARALEYLRSGRTDDVDRILRGAFKEKAS